MVRTKVFVGNLSFQTQESELSTEFGVAGKVISANIITRGPRSLGYGFVEMDSEEDAKKAVTLMNKKEINGRQINVEIAKPQDETKKPQPRAEGELAPKRKPRTRAPKGSKSEDSSDEGKPSKPRGRRAPAADGEADEDNKVRKPRPPRSGKPTGPKRSTEPREESKTTLFVANLPFSLNDEEFAKILTDKQLKLKSAHVVSKKNGKSKGYGFVEFDTQEDQQKALNALNKTTIDSRELSVKVALTELKLEANDDEKDEKPATQEKKPVPQEKKPVQEQKTSPAPPKIANEKKAVAPADKKPATPTADKKTEKKPEVAQKNTASPVATEKKASPAVADKKTATPEKKVEEKK